MTYALVDQARLKRTILISLNRAGQLGRLTALAHQRPHLQEEPDQLDYGGQPVSPAVQVLQSLRARALIAHIHHLLQDAAWHPAPLNPRTQRQCHPDNYWYGLEMSKTQRDMREVQAAAACELAYQAIGLVDQPSMDHVVALSRIRQLTEVLETTVTYLLRQSKYSWEEIGAQLDGVSRQSFHYRLNPKVLTLVNLPPNQVRYRETRAGRDITDELAPEAWKVYLQRIEHIVSTAAVHSYHPEIVHHRRSHA
ncbi:hypothetical protein [Mycobacteroides immunogenum]|nr:hypothetical protein [Mycobacteroides immunogenum]